MAVTVRVTVALLDVEGFPLDLACGVLPLPGVGVTLGVVGARAMDGMGVDGTCGLPAVAVEENRPLRWARGDAAVSPTCVGLGGWPVGCAVAWAYVAPCASCCPGVIWPEPVTAPKGEWVGVGAAPSEEDEVPWEVDMVLMLCGRVWGDEVFEVIAAWFCVVCVREREWS